MKGKLLVVIIIIAAACFLWSRPESAVIRQYLPFNTVARVEHELEREASTNPYLAAVKKHDPDYYDIMRRTIADFCQRKISAEEMGSRFEKADNFNRFLV